jgi:transitional endoplasmic reticulum ATPase
MHCSFFGDPDEESRRLYIEYWQRKLKKNKKIDFPDSLVHRIAAATSKFSFAYMKEALWVLCFHNYGEFLTFFSVSTLVIMAGERHKRAFDIVILEQIDLLRKGIPLRGMAQGFASLNLNAHS